MRAQYWVISLNVRNCTLVRIKLEYITDSTLKTKLNVAINVQVTNQWVLETCWCYDPGTGRKKTKDATASRCTEEIAKLVDYL